LKEASRVIFAVPRIFSCLKNLHPIMSNKFVKWYLKTRCQWTSILENSQIIMICLWCKIINILSTSMSFVKSTTRAILIPMVQRRILKKYIQYWLNIKKLMKLKKTLTHWSKGLRSSRIWKISKWSIQSFYLRSISSQNKLINYLKVIKTLKLVLENLMRTSHKKQVKANYGKLNT
jgi:hypothetical protein